jgi:hypothetical protein
MASPTTMAAISKKWKEKTKAKVDHGRDHAHAVELLACTSHVFVFGDLNYRIDPGVVTGRGWNKSWKRGFDTSSTSIAAALKNKSGARDKAAVAAPDVAGGARGGTRRRRRRAARARPTQRRGRGRGSQD